MKKTEVETEPLRKSRSGKETTVERKWKAVKSVPEEGRVGEQRRGIHGRLVARPLMARTLRGRHGVKPGT